MRQGSPGYLKAREGVAMSGRLEGKIAIVTGSGSGIGRAVASRFAAEGACVVVTDVRGDAAGQTTDEIQRTGGRAEVVVGDVTDSRFVDELVNGSFARHGRLDIMHNNAGGSSSAGLLTEVTDAEWDDTLALN